MKSKIGILITIGLLGYGIIRIGVGSALLAQTIHLVNYTELNEATMEVKQFLEERAGKQIVPFTEVTYFAFIVFMGILLTSGAVGALLRKNWGFVVLWIYISTHAALFINYQEINPKIIILVLQVILLIGLKYLRPANH
ncbi:hypothetical protein [Fulvivirga lutimaris]|uniref:hypothetical protein n=1 Tax=Fulvivirga lutimaris TaxID=1819566 RepID=UPI0012BBA5C7|nr:hypothetical protein [Fulvivirga lutimaris]MTI41149.1 hypothetical protein [Fulvivirga lutimaris]